MKTFGFNCAMGYIGGSGIVLAPSVLEAIEKINTECAKYRNFIPINETDIIEITQEQPFVLLTDGNY